MEASILAIPVYLWLNFHMNFQIKTFYLVLRACTNDLLIRTAKSLQYFVYNLETPNPDCVNLFVACSGDGGSKGSCRKSNVVYEYACQLCPEDNQAVYIGETARNLYTRGREHNRNYEKKENESFIHKHQEEKHHGMLPNFNSKVLYSFQDCLSRQTAEGVCIRRCKKDILNTKSEWHQPSLWRVRSELNKEWKYSTLSPSWLVMCIF